MKVEHKIVAAFVVAAMAVVLLGALTFLNVRGLFERNRWVAHTYEVLGQIDRLFDCISQIESGGRDYVFTGDPQYLQPYQSGIDASMPEIADLRTLTSDNPLQAQNISGLQTLLNRVVASLHERVEARRMQGSAATAVQATSRDKENMDQVRFTVAAMKNLEHRLLSERTARSAVSSRRTLTNFGLLLVLAILLLLGFFVFIRHDLAERRRTDLALRRSDEKFRGVLESAPDAMFITDAHGMIQLVNPQAEQLFGFERDEFVGRTLGSLLIQRLDAIAGEATAEETAGDRDTARTLRDLQAVFSHYDGVRKGGDLFPVDVSRSALEISATSIWPLPLIRDRSDQQECRG